MFKYKSQNCNSITFPINKVSVGQNLMVTYSTSLYDYKCILNFFELVSDLFLLKCSKTDLEILMSDFVTHTN